MSEASHSPVQPEPFGRVRARAEARLLGVSVLGTDRARPMDDRAIVLRLGDRANDDQVPHATPGDKLSANALSMREGAVRERVVTLKPGPNAPLLMRIVRSPYALAVTAGKRIQLLERTRTQAPPALGRPGAEWRASRPGRLFRSPLRIAHGMPERLHPRKPTSQVAPPTSQVGP